MTNRGSGSSERTVQIPLMSLVAKVNDETLAADAA
ncbi:hypothetical protein J2Y48_004706 [Mycoplana sp. BE70]|nr:hypothetical protein [Mycoplana sp. BE70]